MHLQNIKNQIHTMQGELATAEAQRQDARTKLARDSGNPNNLEALRVINGRISDLTESIAILESTLEQAQHDEKSAEGVARRAAAQKSRTAVANLMPKRDTAAAQIDAALDALKAAVAGWVEVNTAIRHEVTSYYTGTFHNDPVGMDNYVRDGVGLADAAANAIASQLSEALSGIGTNQNIVFNFIKKNNAITERVKADSEKSRDILLSRMQQVAGGLS